MCGQLKDWPFVFVIVCSNTSSLFVLCVCLRAGTLKLSSSVTDSCDVGRQCHAWYEQSDSLTLDLVGGILRGGYPGAVNGYMNAGKSSVSGSSPLVVNDAANLTSVELPSVAVAAAEYGFRALPHIVPTSDNLVQVCSSDGLYCLGVGDNPFSNASKQFTKPYYNMNDLVLF